MSGGGTPRQQMIGLMYLVLLAMLAMNASKDLLNAFVMLEKGIDVSNKNFSAKNDRLYDVISAAAGKIESAKVIEKRAFEVRAKVKEIIGNIEKDKTWLVTGGAAPDATPELIASDFMDGGGIPLNKDNQDLGGQYYISGDDPSENGERLKSDISEYREMLIKLIDTDGNKKNDGLKIVINNMLATNDTTIDGANMSWVSTVAEHLPNASVTANLTLWQSYIRNIESEVIGSFASALEGNGMVVTDAEGMAALNSGYVLKGDTLSGRVFLSAYNKNINPVVYIGVVDYSKFKKGQDYVENSDVKAKPPILGSASKVWDGTSGTYQVLGTTAGKANFKSTLITGETGEKEITGVIQMIGKDGAKYYPFKQTYMVAEPSVTVAATKMNVFYVGVPNPVSISAPGVASEDIEVAAPGLRFAATKKAGEYTATASRATGKKGVDVVVKNKSTGIVLGKSTFRVKRLPDPVAKVLGQKEGLVSRGKLKVAQRVDAVMENFDFELRVSVSSFTMTVNMGGDLVEMRTKGNKLDAKMKTMLSRVKKGSRIYFENIKVKMPGGKPRKVPSIIFKVK
jgi:gliding motility-associated protein GldM